MEVVGFLPLRSHQIKCLVLPGEPFSAKDIPAFAIICVGGFGMNVVNLCSQCEGRRWQHSMVGKVIAA